ncbi:MAG: AI-2E family transporter [Acidobacteriota bacterium]
MSFSVKAGSTINSNAVRVRPRSCHHEFVRSGPERRDQRSFTRERLVTVVLAGATVAALYVCYLIVQPFITTLAIAVALAVATYQPYQWLLGRLQNKGWAAAVAVTLVGTIIIAPVTLLITHVAQQIVVTINGLQNGATWSQWLDAMHAKPVLGDALRWAESNFDFEAQISGIAKNLAGQAGNLLKNSFAALVQLVIVLFVLFFLYRDNRSAVKAVRTIIPLSDREASRMFTRISNTIHATVNGSLTVALAQSILGGIMYSILGVPTPMIWGVATFFTALVPVFGTFTVWGPIAAYLALSGCWIKALILITWGLVAIGTIDNLLYPYLVGDRLRLHTVPTFFAILGGIQLFGVAGLVLGPLALSVTIGLLEIWWSRTEEGRTAEVSGESGRHSVSPAAALETKAP